MTQENEMPGEIWVHTPTMDYCYDATDSCRIEPREETSYIRRAVSKEEAGRLSGVVDFTLEYFEEEFPKEAFPDVWNEPLSHYAGGLTPNDIFELKKLLEAHK